MSIDRIEFSSRPAKLKFPVLPPEGLGEVEMVAVPWNDGLVEILMPGVDAGGKPVLRALTNLPSISASQNDDQMTVDEMLGKLGPLPLHFRKVTLPAPLYISAGGSLNTPYANGAMAPEARFGVDVLYRAENTQKDVKKQPLINKEDVGAKAHHAIAHVMVDANTGLLPRTGGMVDPPKTIGELTVPDPKIAELHRDRDGEWTSSPDGLITLPILIGGWQYSVLSLRTQIVGDRKYILLFARPKHDAKTGLDDYLGNVGSEVWICDAALNTEGESGDYSDWTQLANKVFLQNAFIGPLPTSAPVGRKTDTQTWTAKDWREQLRNNEGRTYLHTTEWINDRWTYCCRLSHGDTYYTIADQGGASVLSLNTDGAYNIGIKRDQPYNFGSPQLSRYTSRDPIGGHLSYPTDIGPNVSNFPILDLSRNPDDPGQFRLAYTVEERFDRLTKVDGAETIKTASAPQPTVPDPETASKADASERPYARQHDVALIASGNRLPLARLPDTDPSGKYAADIRERLNTVRDDGYAVATGPLTDNQRNNRSPLLTGTTLCAAPRLVVDVCGRVLDAACTYRPFGMVAYPSDEFPEHLPEIATRRRFAWGEEPYFNGRLIKFTSLTSLLDGPEGPTDFFDLNLTIWSAQAQIETGGNVLSKLKSFAVDPVLGAPDKPSDWTLSSLSTRWGKAYFTEPEKSDAGAKCDADQTGPDLTAYALSAAGQTNDVQLTVNAHNFVVARGQAVNESGQLTNALTDHLFYWGGDGQLYRRIRIDNPMATGKPAWTDAEEVLKVSQVVDENEIPLPVDHEPSFGYIVDLKLLAKDGRPAKGEAISIATNSLDPATLLTLDGLLSVSGANAEVSLKADDAGRILFAVKSGPLAAPTFVAKSAPGTSGEPLHFLLPLNQGLFETMAAWKEPEIASLIPHKTTPETLQVITKTINKLATHGIQQGRAAGLEATVTKSESAAAIRGLAADTDTPFQLSFPGHHDGELANVMVNKSNIALDVSEPGALFGIHVPVPKWVSKPLHKAEKKAQDVANKIAHEADKTVVKVYDAAKADLKDLKNAGENLVHLAINDVEIAVTGGLAFALVAAQDFDKFTKDAFNDVEGAYTNIGHLIAGVMDAVGSDANAVWHLAVKTAEDTASGAEKDFEWIVNEAGGLLMGLEKIVSTAVKEAIGDIKDVEKFGTNAKNLIENDIKIAVDDARAVATKSVAAAKSFASSADSALVHVEKLLEGAADDVFKETDSLMAHAVSLAKTDIGWVGDHIGNLSAVASAADGLKDFLASKGDTPSAPKKSDTHDTLQTKVEDLFTAIETIADNTHMGFATDVAREIQTLSSPAIKGFDDLLGFVHLEDKLPLSVLDHIIQQLSKLADLFEKNPELKAAIDKVNPIRPDAKAMTPSTEVSIENTVSASVVGAANVICGLISGLLDLGISIFRGLAGSFPLTVGIGGGALGTAKVDVDAGGSAVVEITAGTGASGSAGLQLGSTLIGITAAIAFLLNTVLGVIKLVVDFVASLIDAAGSITDAVTG